MTARYALYYVPADDDALYRAASAWLGRCAFTGASVARPTLSGLDGVDVDALTADPRRYGFHATLKAPFELADGVGEDDLAQAAADYAAGLHGFVVDLSVAALGPFLALRLAQPSTPMQRLHEECVRHFERFRAPLSEFDLRRRLRPGMSERQEQQLRTFGYPGIFDDFRFHMTLTGPVGDAALHERVLAALTGYFAKLVGPHAVAGLALAKQDNRDADFVVLSWSPFAG